MKKRFLITAIALFLVSATVSAATISLTDISSHQYKNSINALVDFDVINGYPDLSFKPDNIINRAEFSKMLIAAKFDQATIDSCDKSQLDFGDIDKNAWYAPYICVAVENFIVNGNPDGNFYPANNINYVESLKILYETYDEPGKENPVGTEWYAKYLEDAEETLNLGYSIVASNFIKRGEVAHLIYSFMDIKDTGIVAESRRIDPEDFNPIDITGGGEVGFEIDDWSGDFDIDMDIYDLDTDYAFIYNQTGIEHIWDVDINGYFLKPLCRGWAGAKDCFIRLPKERLVSGTNTISIVKTDAGTNGWTLNSADVIPFSQGGAIRTSVYEIDKNTDSTEFRFDLAGTPNEKYILVGKARNIGLSESDPEIECTLPSSLDLGTEMFFNNNTIIEGILCWDWLDKGYIESDLPEYYQYEFFDGSELFEGLNTVTMLTPEAIVRNILLENIWIVPVR